MLVYHSVRVQGIKSSKEKFAGALFTTTVEAFVPMTGKGIQVSCLPFCSNPHTTFRALMPQRLRPGVHIWVFAV